MLKFNSWLLFKSTFKQLEKEKKIINIHLKNKLKYLPIKSQRKQQIFIQPKFDIFYIVISKQAEEIITEDKYNKYNH